MIEMRPGWPKPRGSAIAFKILDWAVAASVRKGIRSRFGAVEVGVGFEGSVGVVGGDIVNIGLVCVMLVTFVSGRY